MEFKTHLCLELLVCFFYFLSNLIVHACIDYSYTFYDNGLHVPRDYHPQDQGSKCRCVSSPVCFLSLLNDVLGLDDGHNDRWGLTNDE